MSDDKDRTSRRTPPESEEDWLHIWTGTHKAHKSWVVTGPVYAVVSNWKAIVAVLLFLGWLNGPEIIAFLEGFWGVKK